MLADAGCGWVLAGHSERRLDHGEIVTPLPPKASQAITAGLKPMICVGESLAEREAGDAEDIVADQIGQSLPENGDIGAPMNLSGRSVQAGWRQLKISPPCTFIFAMYCQICWRSAVFPILYGGSVKADNAAAIMAIDHVGGVLVGGASLSADDFLAIAGSAI